MQGESPTYILNEDTQPVIRAIGVSQTACKDEFRQNLRSHSWSVFLFYNKWERKQSDWTIWYFRLMMTMMGVDVDSLQFVHRIYQREGIQNAIYHPIIILILCACDFLTSWNSECLHTALRDIRSPVRVDVVEGRGTKSPSTRQLK